MAAIVTIVTTSIAIAVGIGTATTIAITTATGITIAMTFIATAIGTATTTVSAGNVPTKLLIARLSGRPLSAEGPFFAVGLLGQYHWEGIRLISVRACLRNVYNNRN